MIRLALPALLSLTLSLGFPTVSMAAQAGPNRTIPTWAKADSDELIKAAYRTGDPDIRKLIDEKFAEKKSLESVKGDKEFMASLQDKVKAFNDAKKAEAQKAKASDPKLKADTKPQSSQNPPPIVNDPPKGHKVVKAKGARAQAAVIADQIPGGVTAPGDDAPRGPAKKSPKEDGAGAPCLGGDCPGRGNPAPPISNQQREDLSNVSAAIPIGPPPAPASAPESSGSLFGGLSSENLMWGVGGFALGGIVGGLLGYGFGKRLASSSMDYSSLYGMYGYNGFPPIYPGYQPPGPNFGGYGSGLPYAYRAPGGYMGGFGSPIMMNGMGGGYYGGMQSPIYNGYTGPLGVNYTLPSMYPAPRTI